MSDNHKKNGSIRHCLLSEAPIDTPVTVSAISAGRQAQYRLASLGILPGETIRVVRRDNGGPLLLEVKGTRVAIGRGLSTKVSVRERNSARSD